LYPAKKTNHKLTEKFTIYGAKVKLNKTGKELSNFNKESLTNTGMENTKGLMNHNL